MSRPMWHLVSLTVFPPPLRNTHIWSTCSATNVKLVSRLKLSWIYNTPLRNTQRCLDNTWSCKEVFNWLTVAVYIAHWQMYLVHLVHKYVLYTICSRYNMQTDNWYSVRDANCCHYMVSGIMQPPCSFMLLVNFLVLCTCCRLHWILLDWYRSPP